MPRAITKTGPGAIADVWAAAKRVHAEIEASAFTDPDPNLPRDGIKPGQWEGAPYSAMPPNCPIEVVGEDRDHKIWCINANGYLVRVEKWDNETLNALFRPHWNFVKWAWPAWGKKDVVDEATGELKKVLFVNRAERDKAFECLGNQAGRLPRFDPETQHRGRGGWKDDEGGFVWHSGRYLWSVRNGALRNIAPRQIGRHLYARGQPMMEPWAGPVKPEESPARALLAELQTWNFARPYLDPILLLGWLVTAFMGAASEVRPVALATGGFGVGKSMLQRLLRLSLGDTVFTSEDATAASIYQSIRHDSIPVMIDEIENKPGSQKAQNIVELARVAYSGGKVNRGGAEGNGTFYQLYCSFFLSAINPPQGGDQDKSRRVTFNLSKIKPVEGQGRKRLVVRDTDGPMILRQVMDGWAEHQAVILPKWWNLLASLPGIDSRSIDTLATLLAAAELVMGDDFLEEAGLPVTDEPRLVEILQAATEDERAARLDNWHNCLNHLLACSIDAWKDGKRPTVGGVMDELARGALDVDISVARDKLEMVNLGVRPKGALGDPGGGPYLAIPADGPQLSRLFAGSDWASGGWTPALRQEQGAVVVKRFADRNKQVVKINGAARRCSLVDMAAFGRYCDGL